jgi:putative DNA primase/helicase
VLSCDVGTKDALQVLNGKWMVELAELASLNRAEVGKIKQYITDRQDTYRPPYGRTPSDFQRQNVFAGTVNDGQYLRDDTGARRFWPVKCPTLDLEALDRDADQLLAEAVVRYRSGERRYPIDRDRVWLEAEQDPRHVADPWENAVASYLDQRRNEAVTTHTVLTVCLGKSLADVTRADETRVGTILHRLDWHPGGPTRPRRYQYSPNEDEAEEDDIEEESTPSVDGEEVQL